jgi:hypothetical protein
MKIATIFLSIISASATIGLSGSGFAYDDWTSKKVDIKIRMRSMGFGLTQIEAVEFVAISIAIEKTCGSGHVKVPFETEANLVAKIHNIPVGVVIDQARALAALDIAHYQGNPDDRKLFCKIAEAHPVLH